MEVFFVTRVWDVFWVVADQALTLDGDLEMAMLVDDLVAESGVGTNYVFLAFVWTMVDHTLRHRPLGDWFAFAILLALGGSWCEGVIWAWGRCRCKIVHRVSWCGAKTGGSICLVIAVVHGVEEIVDAKHVSVDWLRELLARDAITTVLGRADSRKHGLLWCQGLGHSVMQKRKQMLKKRCKQTAIA